MEKPKKIKYPYEYDTEKRRKAKAYTKIKIIAGVVNGMLVPIVFLLLFFFLGFSSQLKTVLGEGPLLIPLFVLVLLLLMELVELPLKFYSSYLYEHKYKLSRHTKRSWSIEKVKELLVGLVFGVPILTVVYLLMGLQHWWVYAIVLYFFIDVFMGTIWPVLILPLFYKLHPFKDKALRKKLLDFARNAGSKNIQDVLVAKESDKSVKANAFFAGIGKTKRMVLFDTLLDSFTTKEVETVIGHELGHYVHKDILKGIALGTLLLFPVFYIIHLALSSLGLVGDIVSLPIFLAVFDLLGIILMPLENAFSRRWERAADWFGLDAAREPEAQISTEKRLADQALSDHNPHPFVEWLLYTHPSAEKRIQMVRDWQARSASRAVGPASLLLKARHARPSARGGRKKGK
ncbi:MAG: M48 family metallopeptidase [Candidatus Aenigmarchaeota archaeon]|nr:M48 family metallopeptidase [Candidatus Aenigmarchaeota archaeon]